MAALLTGVKPTGLPHIGNYLGAMCPALERQGNFDTFLFFADYHALTTVRDREEMQESTYQVAATWLACGLDLDHTTFYRQSDIPEVFELNWLLACVCPKGELDRAHAFKASVAEGRNINAGLYTYPVLMAADILLFQTNFVPVGKDQIQHVETARELANKINNAFGNELLALPQPLITEDLDVVPGIDGRKMSKSYKNEVGIFLPPKKLRKRVMQIVTDSTTVDEPKDPDGSNLFAMYESVATAEQAEDLATRLRAGGMGWGHAKLEFFEVLEARFGPLRNEYERLMAERGYLDEVLESGAVRARSIASQTMSRLRKATGIR